MGKNEIELNGKIYILKEDVKENKTPEKWNPKPGDFYIGCEGDVYESDSTEPERMFGIERQTEELAKRASKEMRIHNRLLAYRDEFCPDYTPDWSDKKEEKYSVSYCHDYNVYKTCSYNYMRILGAVWFTKEEATELVKKLNSGEVTL